MTSGCCRVCGWAEVASAYALREWPDPAGTATPRRVPGVRIGHPDGHLRAAHDGLARGADLRGDLVWSVLDNFEWAEGGL
ncbi:hypothetical protein LQ51_22335 [Micromonospora sp. HK10]|nr:hypothetical protein LQ51_22335 [Micromonospora sp. HK10]